MTIIYIQFFYTDWRKKISIIIAVEDADIKQICDRWSCWLLDKKASLFTGNFSNILSWWPLNIINSVWPTRKWKWSKYVENHSTLLKVLYQPNSESDLHILKTALSSQFNIIESVLATRKWKLSTYFEDCTQLTIQHYWKGDNQQSYDEENLQPSINKDSRSFSENDALFSNFWLKTKIQYLDVIFVYILWLLSKLSFNDIVFNSYVFVKNVFKWIEMWVCKHLWEGLGHIIARYKRVYPLTRGMKDVTNLNSWFWKSHHIDLTQSVLNLLGIWGYSISVFYSKTLLLTSTSYIIYMFQPEWKLPINQIYEHKYTWYKNDGI